MSDDLRDKFGSDDEFEEFKNSFKDYKNKTGMFDQSQFAQDYIKMIIKVEELMYKNFVLEKKKFFRVPDEILKAKYVSLYMFYFENLLEFPETLPIFMN